MSKRETEVLCGSGDQLTPHLCPELHSSTNDYVNKPEGHMLLAELTPNEASWSPKISSMNQADQWFHNTGQLKSAQCLIPLAMIFLIVWMWRMVLGRMGTPVLNVPRGVGGPSAWSEVRGHFVIEKTLGYCPQSHLTRGVSSPWARKPERKSFTIHINSGPRISPPYC